MKLSKSEFMNLHMQLTRNYRGNKSVTVFKKSTQNISRCRSISVQWRLTSLASFSDIDKSIPAC